MEDTRNGIPASDLHGAIWRKSRRSNSQGTCVELACLPAGAIAVRNSRYPSGPALVYTSAEFDAFINGAKDGDFDDLLTGPGVSS
jgi:Domain of unknown function (DUF397)